MILVDNSTVNCEVSWFTKAVDNFSCYDELRLDILQRIAVEYERASIGLDNGRLEVYFPSQVIYEMDNFANKLEHKVRMFELVRDHQLERRQRETAQAKYTRVELRKIGIWHEAIRDFARNNEYAPFDEENFKRLRDYIVKITKRDGIKRKRKEKTIPLEEQEVLYADRKIGRKKDYKADEELVACAMSHIAVYNASCGILTRNHHIRLITKNVLKDMLRTGKFPEVLEAIKRNPIWLYYSDPMPWEINTDRMLAEAIAENKI